MLDYFLTLKDPQGEPASMSALVAEIGNLIAAGADTTSVALKAVLGPILQDRTRYQRLRDELDDAVSSSKESALTYSTIKNLPFLTACIKEGLRMHPSIIY
ncbi:cytochrome P450 [Aspergillus multicolor]|uniref:cytochrome P450 n=1 Tax=Aspergillus multicolor TaxID=41759 RepID=UPI003CCE11EF